MPLPPKEYYTLTEVAERWDVPVRTIQDYLLTDRLEASIYLPRLTICHFTEQFDYAMDLHDDDASPYIYEIDVNDRNSVRARQGLFNLVYKDIEWDEHGIAILEKDGLYLTLPDEKGYFAFNDDYTVELNDILITRAELNRFEAEHNINADDLAGQQNRQEELVVATPVTVPKLHTKEKESLLKMIIVLAVDAYRYNPDDKKSTVPGEIASTAQQLGLSIDVDTVRKWLKEAASLLPREEQPL
jgi:hypothetical protein